MSHTYLEHGVLCDRTGEGLGVSLVATYRGEPGDADWRTLGCLHGAPHHLVMRTVALGDWSEPLATETAS